MEHSVIKNLIIYPIKSLGPVFFDSIEVGAQGLSDDRQMMLVDAKGMFITQRTRTDLVRFQVKRSEDSFKVIDRWGNQEMLIRTEGFDSTMPEVRIWDDQVQQVWRHPEMSEWFSDILKEKLHLVKLNPSHERKTAEKYQTGFSSSTSFADALPILLCTTASFRAIEQDYGNFDFLRFRPNIVLKNEIAFEEDAWASLELGGLSFEMKKRCARCQLITVDPHSGEVDKTFLKRLSAYRTDQNKVYFGVQLVPNRAGVLSVGDALTNLITCDS
jgi:uncharacterized protein YcbX